MAQQVFGPAAVVSVLNRAFTNTSPSNAVFNNQLAQAGTTEASQYAFAESFGATFAVGKTAAELSALVMANMGLDNQLLADALTDYITVHGTNKIGIIAYQLGTLLSPLENDATYGAAAKAWNAEVTASYEYSADPSNTVPSTSDVNGNEAGKNFVLTAGQDVRTGTSGADFFRGVAGVQVGNQDQTTLNSSDILDGGAGQDTLILNLTGANYIGGARIKNIETLQIGTNLGLANFDYNVNAGQNEITEVTTIVYDQINVNETLTVNNILKTGEALPTLAWKNEAGSQAGTVNANYRASAVAGATDQAVELHNVMAVNADATTGRLNIGGGVETLTITSTGTTANTLNASTNVDGRNADLVSGSNDGVPDNGVLTKVVVKGDQAFGRAATVVTNDVAGELNFGLTNHVASSDLGLNNQASASNLVSVAGTVTEIDATEADGGVAMRFVGRNDGAAVNVTFKGGNAADYIEFERGNVNAAGGEGNDTFAFINNNLTSFDFGSADSIVGGAGVDTIQLGVNGIGSVVANTTEFNNKTGIDVLDLRGNSNTVTLADAFVSSADAGTFIVRTDKIAQTSDTSTANTAPSNASNAIAVARENASVNTIVLTELADNRAIEFIGGSGSDRVVVDNASANQYTKLDGGSNNGSAATGAAGSNDSLTVVNTAVLDAADVANIKGFELLNLVENTVGNNTFNVTLSEAFLLANSTATTVLTIASVANTYGQRLNAGDVVNLEISDLLSAGTAKASIAGRMVNVQDLIAAGVTVNFQQNGATVTTNAAPAALAANLNLITAPAATLLDDVPGGLAAVPPVVGGGGAGGAVGNTFTLTAAGAVLTTAASNLVTPAATYLSAGSDTITAGINFLNGSLITDTTTTDADVLNATITGFNAAVINGIETINLQSFGGTLGLATVTGASTINVTGAAATFTGAEAETLVVGSGFTGLLTAGGTAATNAFTVRVNGTAAGTALTTTNTAGLTIDVAATSTLDTLTTGANSTVTVTGTGNLTITNALTDGGGGTVTLNASALVGGITVTADTNGGTITGGTGADSVTGGAAADSIFGGAGNDTINVSQAGADTVRGGQGNDTITLGGVGADDTVVFENSAANNGTDAITGFAVGNAAAADVGLLDFTAFVTGRYVDDAATAQADTNVIGNVFSAAQNNDRAVNNAVVAFDSVTALTAAELAAEFNGAGNAFAVSAGQRTVVLEGNATAATRGVNVWYVHDVDGNGVVADAEVVLVGTINAGTFLDLNTIVANQIL